MNFWFLANRRHALPPILDGRELVRPWKLFSFAVGTALMLVGSVYYEISDWDLGISVVMPLLTYVTAPWVVRVLVGGYFRHLPLALFWAWFTIDGVYWFYHTQFGNEMLRLENALTSTPIYFGMGFFWLPRTGLGEIFAVLRGRGLLPSFRPEPAAPRPLGLAPTLAAFACGGLLWALLVEPLWIEVKTQRIGRVEAGRPPIRVLQLSDLHLSRFGWREGKLLPLVAAQRPDLIVLTGDYLERPVDLDRLEAFFAALPKVPRLAVPGNWEVMSGVDRAELVRRAAAQGVRFLVDESVVVATPTGALRVTGLDDAFTGQPDWARATRGVPADERLPHLVLQHSPAYRDTLNRRLAEGRGRPPLVMLAGHTHGGQVDLFGWRPLLPPGSGAYAAGWYREAASKNAVPLYVSRGIGVSVLPLRFGVRPEITVFEVGR